MNQFKFLFNNFMEHLLERLGLSVQHCRIILDIETCHCFMSTGIYWQKVVFRKAAACALLRILWKKRFKLKRKSFFYISFIILRWDNPNHPLNQNNINQSFKSPVHQQFTLVLWTIPFFHCILNNMFPYFLFADLFSW